MSAKDPHPNLEWEICSGFQSLNTQFNFLTFVLRWSKWSAFLESGRVSPFFPGTRNISDIFLPKGRLYKCFFLLKSHSWVEWNLYHWEIRNMSDRVSLEFSGSMYTKRRTTNTFLASLWGSWIWPWHTLFSEAAPHSQVCRWVEVKFQLFCSLWSLKPKPLL